MLPYQSLLYMHMYVYMYICIYVYVSLSLYICINVYVYACQMFNTLKRITISTTAHVGFVPSPGVFFGSCHAKRF